MMQLNYSRLNGEYLTWSLDYGDGRNDEDIRFGQHIHNKYDMSHLKADVFYVESCEKAYSELLKELYTHEEK